MTKGTGALRSPKDLRNYKISTKISIPAQLPDTFIVAHSHIKDQGSVNSCVAHSVTEVFEAYNNINYSAGWIYGYRPISYYQGPGMHISEALKTLKKVGCLTNNELNVNIEMDKIKELVDRNIEDYKQKAEQYKIFSYAYLGSLQEIKEAVFSSQLPVIISISVNIKSDIELDKNFVAKVPDVYGGDHAMVCYGWNEKGLLIQNSWGKEWGNNGTFILPYDYPIAEAWAINFSEENKIIEKPNFYKIREITNTIINYITNKFFKKEN